MPCNDGLVLTVDPNVIHKVDTNDHQNLFSMWTVFSRCADSVEQGRRLENLSWRLWNRETFCCDGEAQQGEVKKPAAATLSPKDIPADRRIPDVPQLSGSVDSVQDDEEAVEFSDEEGLEIARPSIVRQDSNTSNSSRGRERHISSDHLEKLVVTIIQEREPNLAPLPKSMSSSSLDVGSVVSQATFSPTQHDDSMDGPSTPATETMSDSVVLPSTASPAHSLESDAQSSSCNTTGSRTTVVRGFSPSHASIPALRLMSRESLKLPEQHAIPEPNATPAPRPVKKQPARFALGGSSGSESSPQSVEIRQPAPQPKKSIFMIGGSSGSAEGDSPSLKSAMHSSRPSSLLNAQKKQTSFSNEVTTRTIQNSSESDSYMDESAIDDEDDESEWEDSIDENGKSSMDDPVTFKRVPSKVNLPSQRSLISLMFAGQEQRAKHLSNQASQSTSAIPHRSARSMQPPSMLTSPNDSDDHGLEMRGGRTSRPAPPTSRPSNLNPISEVPRTGAQPIAPRPQMELHQSTLSPRTTRRNMLATELTESLRRDLLWERQQKSSTANAVMKRRHTSTDLVNLRQEAGPSSNKAESSAQGAKAAANSAARAKRQDEADARSWNRYFNRDTMSGYNAKGW